MKNIYLLLILSCVTLKSVAQVVIDPKGTKVVLDSSKWKISGNDIYNKNTGNVGIGVTVPTAQLHSNGSVRLQGIGTNTINTNVVTTDANGNVTTRTLSSLLNGNAITSLNGLTSSTQTFATGTLGTDFNIASSGSTHTFNFPTASATNRGLLSTANWSTFNNKIGAVTATTAAAVSTVGTTATINNTLAYWNANQLQGRNITSTAPTTGQVLTYNVTTSNWEPAAAAPVTTTNTLTNTANTITSTVNGVAATAPAVNTVANSSVANNLSTTVNGITGTTVPIINSISNTSSANSLTTSVNGVAGSGVNIINTNALTQNGTNQLISTVNGIAATALTANVTGDVTGNLGAAVVSKINGSPLGTTTGATSGQTLSWNGTAWAPANAAPSVTTNTLGLSGNTLTSTVNGVAATSNAVGSISNTSSANSLSTTINGVAGTGVNIINSNALTQNGTNQLISTVNGIAATALTANVTGDVTGNLGAAVVSKINGSPLGTTTGATSGQTLSWNGTAWAPANAAPATTTHTLTNTVNTINSTVNGISVTAPAVNTVANNSSTNTLTTTVNGVSGTGVNIINSNALNLSSGALTSVVNGVSSGTANVLATANNGLTATSGNVQLGGALTQPTTITTSASNTLTIAGLQSGATTDSLLTVDGAGVIKRRSAPTITSSGPWFNQATGTPATANTQNIYQLGNVGIRNSSPDEALDVAGKIKLSSGKPQDTIYSNNSSGLVLQSLGNTFGTVQLTIQNINGSNGAVFESVGAGNPQLLDFGFKTTSGGQRNLRFETRVNDAFANGGTPEFQFGIAANPTLVVSDAVTFVRKGNLGVGINNPSQALDVNGFITTRLGLMGNSAIPTIAAGAGAGTSPTVSVVGNNVGGRVTITTGALPAGTNATIATITYSGVATFPNGSSVVLYPANAITATLSGVTMVFAAGNQTTFTIRSGTVALTASTQYSWNYHIIGY